MMDCSAFKRDSGRSLSIKARVEWRGGQRFFSVPGAQWTLGKIRARGIKASTLD